jgi:hypothetical protein
VPGFVFWSLMMPGFPCCLGVVAPKLLRSLEARNGVQLPMAILGVSLFASVSSGPMPTSIGRRECGLDQRCNVPNRSGQNGAAQLRTIQPATAPNITPVMRIGA